ncbi:MAG: VWA domain-containing protein [Planctomycetes bacterium]|nr:VWA domain-containing protein [Planctomycetota bacterium]
MLSLLLATALSGPVAAVGPLPTPTSMVVAGDEKPLRALDAWVKHWRTGKMDVRSKANIAKDSIAAKFGLSPGGLGNPTWAGDLEVICSAVAKLDTEDAAKALVEVAALGLVPGDYSYAMAPYEVRAVAEAAAAKLTAPAAREALAKFGRGVSLSDKAQAMALQTAALRCIGLGKDKSQRSVLENGLGDGDELVRATAAEMLGLADDVDAALPLVALLERETSDSVLIAGTAALQAIYRKHVPKTGVFQSAPGPDGKPAEAAPAPATPAAPIPESVRLAVRAAGQALGRTTWRADMALVRLMDEYRSLECVPALIGVLERYAAHPEEVKSGKLSGLLLYQAHELLVAMTGAIHPATQPDTWRAFWDAERDKIVVAERKEPKPGAADGGAGKVDATVAGGFCGIPVQGTRVVFVLDLSGSMKWKMEESAADGKKVLSERLDFAKRELVRAMDVIAPNAQFNLVTFNGDDKAESWSKDLVPATEKNRERFKKYVDGLEARGGTNLWSGLESALRIRSLVYGARYQSNVDEVFVLSDGAPTVGDVQDPIEILRLVTETNKFAKVRINTVFISSATPAEARQAEPRMAITPQELMRRMAENNGGKFREL